MKVDFYISQSEKGKFAQSCEAVLSSVGSATRAATEEACKAILDESLKQVPRDTGALASTAWHHVESAFMQGSNKLSSNRFVGYVGYAGAERTRFQVNERLASEPGYESGGHLELFPGYSTKFKQFQGTHHPGGKSSPSIRSGSGKYTKVGGYAGHGVQNAINPKTGKEVSRYAAIVHEDLSMPHPNGGKAKFLEDPVRDYAASKFRRTLVHYWKYAIEWGNMYGAQAMWRVNTTTSAYFNTDIVRHGDNSWKGESV